MGTDPATTALDFVRGQGLIGAKEGCAEGECGACAVLVVRPDGTDRSRWTAVNACLVPAAALDGQEVVTAEGLGAPGALHPVQRELAVRGGSQCGYCTPGFVCAMAAEYYREDRRGGAHPDHEHGPNGFDLHAIGGNLCRCTGYRPIRDAAFALDRPTRRTPSPNGSTGPRPPWPPPASWARAARSSAPSTSPTSCGCSTSTPTPSSSPAPPTGGSTSTCAAPAHPSSSASTGCPSFAA